MRSRDPGRDATDPCRFSSMEMEMGLKEEVVAERGGRGGMARKREGAKGGVEGGGCAWNLRRGVRELTTCFSKFRKEERGLDNSTEMMMMLCHAPARRVGFERIGETVMVEEREKWERG